MQEGFPQIVNIADDLIRLHSMGVLEPLLVDHTTGGNILWATDAYAERGPQYEPTAEIAASLITGPDNAGIIQTRARKAFEQQSARTRQRAEVYTPLWIVKMMCDQMDAVWFRRKDGFSKIIPETNHVYFNKNRTWTAYVKSTRLEITCGEGPYLASRYDAPTGEIVSLRERVGILDRKLRVIGENVDSEIDWLRWAVRAFRSVYGFEYQGDSLLIARVNALMTFIDYFSDRWGHLPNPNEYHKIAEIISWNLWEMDGLSSSIPYRTMEKYPQMLIDGWTVSQVSLSDIPKQCVIYDWRKHCEVEYSSLREKGVESMKFDFVIGNPPYQEEAKEGTIQAKPIYNHFVDSAKKITNHTLVMITPARWFSGGMGLDSFRKAMLTGNQITKIYEFANAKECFPMNSISGGVCIFVLDNHYKGECEFINVVNGNQTPLKRRLDEFPVLVRNNNALAIIHKVRNLSSDSLSEFVSSISPFGLSTKERGDSQPQSPSDLKLYSSAGVSYIKKDSVTKGKEYIQSYKVMLSQTGAEHAGEPSKDRMFRVLSSSMRVLSPSEVCTHSYILLNPSDSVTVPQNTIKYLKTRFVRCLILQTITSIHISKSSFIFVPTQDFTNYSDINWKDDVSEIDKQLYAKYGLSEKEIAFIESHVKEMA